MWIGRNAKKNEKEEALVLAKAYLKESNSMNDRDLETSITLVESGKEPPIFTCHFLGWDDTRMDDFIDPYKEKLKNLNNAQDQVKLLNLK